MATTDADTGPDVTEADAEPTVDDPEATRRPGPPVGLLVAATCVSLAAALFVAWLVVRPAGGSDTVSPEEMVSGEPEARVEVQGKVAVGSPAPTARYTHLDGTEGSLADFAGTPTLVNFWSSTCAPCLSEMPTIERVMQDAAGDLAVLGVDVTDSVEAGTKMVERTGVTYPIARDPKGEMIAAFGGTRLPHSVLIGRDGTVVAIEDGALDEGELRDLLGP